MTCPEPDGLTAFQRSVCEVVRGLRRGEVASYAEVAEEAGRPGAARGVGAVLRQVDDLPWWRVVRADGTCTQGERQADLLRAEGVPVEGMRVRPRR